MQGIRAKLKLDNYNKKGRWQLKKAFGQLLNTNAQ
jgi:hypothetical protein